MVWQSSVLGEPALQHWTPAGIRANHEMVVGEPPKRDGHRGGHRDVPIETKLHAPGLRREWVERPELVAELANSPARLILVDAPVGSGKTTAVAQWPASVPDRRRFA